MDKMTRNSYLFKMSVPIFVELLLQLLVGNIDQIMGQPPFSGVGGRHRQRKSDYEYYHYHNEYALHGHNGRADPVSWRGG